MSKDIITNDSKEKSLFFKLKNNKKLQIILIIVCVLLLIFIFIGNFISKDISGEEVSSIDSYVKNLENKLSETLSKVEGAGDVSVVITVESGMETVLASKINTTETTNGIQTEETPIIVNGKTVIVKELYPKIVGVLIVAEGADNITVMKRLQQATLSLLDININQIEILSMN